MHIGLIDVDSHNFPNLPLMKISTWHKTNGDSVEWYDNFANKYDIVYLSKVFDFTPDYEYIINADSIIKGGTGYKLSSTLHSDIEHCYPDYALYPKHKEAYGFLTRGCPRGCSFCIVTEKEGKVSNKTSDLSEFWRGQNTIKLLDANILACKDRESLLQQCIESKANIDFTQGLDIRLLNAGVICLLKQCRMKYIHFAWDSEKDSDLICNNLKLVRDSGFNLHNTIFYVLTNFDTTFEFDLYRVYTLRDFGVLPFVMVYNISTADKKYKRLQNWVNNKFIFRKCNHFEDYKPI